MCRRPSGAHVGLTPANPPNQPLSYKVLALKYRPTSFDEVVGQTTVTRTLQNALERGKIGHAFLLSGARGVGKTTTARILAKALNCAKAEGPTANPCSTRTEESRAAACSSCREIADGRSLDVQEIDGASNTGVDSIRELREMARYSPARDRFKVWIIDEVHQISGAAFNALLKTLEEPPPRVKFIFATTEYHKIPETILSRCQQYDFRMISTRELARHLRSVADQERIQVSDQALALVARAAEGSARDALSLFDQVLAFTGDAVKDDEVAGLLGLVDRELLRRATRAIVDGSSLAMLELVESLADYGADYRNFVRELLLHLREVLLVKLAPPGSPLLSQILPEEAQELRRLRGRALGRGPAARPRPADAGRGRASKRHRPARRARPGAAQAGADAPAGSVRRGGGPSRALPRRGGIGSGRLPLPCAARAARSASCRGSAPCTRARARRRRRRRPGPPWPRAGSPTTSRAWPHPRAPPRPCSRRCWASARAGPRSRHRCAPPRPAPTATRSCSSLPPDFLTFAREHGEDYRALARKAAGHALALRMEAGRAAAALEPAAPSHEAVKRQKLREEAEKEPAVQEALDLFDGRVVDVRET